MCWTLLVEGTTIAVESQKRVCYETDQGEIDLSLRRNSVFYVLQNYDQSATVGLVPLSATIDTISIDFMNLKIPFF